MKLLRVVSASERAVVGRGARRVTHGRGAACLAWHTGNLPTASRGVWEGGKGATTRPCSPAGKHTLPEDPKVGLGWDESLRSSTRGEENGV